MADTSPVDGSRNERNIPYNSVKQDCQFEMHAHFGGTLAHDVLVAYTAWRTALVT
jgi:hypothetical protein